MSPERFTVLKEQSKNNKLLIGIGCSFTQGQGGLKDEVWEKYNWDIPNTHYHLELEELEVQGSWVSQLCERYMPDWTPINLGERGGGNRAAVKYLTSVFPELELDDPDKEKIVVFMLTGPERYTIVHHDWAERFHGVFQSIWPRQDSDNELWRAYANVLYSKKQTMMETYFSIKEVQNWCKANDAKLLILSAFDFSYAIDYTPEQILANIDLPWTLDLYKPLGHPSAFHMLLDKDGFSYHILGHPSAFHMLLDKDGFSYHIQNGGYWEKLNYTDAYPKGTPHVSRCCHPNYKGHALIAEQMYEEFKNRKFVD